MSGLKTARWWDSWMVKQWSTVLKELGEEFMPLSKTVLLEWGGDEGSYLGMWWWLSQAQDESLEEDWDNGMVSKPFGSSRICLMLLLTLICHSKVLSLYIHRCMLSFSIALRKKWCISRWEFQIKTMWILHWGGIVDWNSPRFFTACLHRDAVGFSIPKTHMSLMTCFDQQKFAKIMWEFGTRAFTGLHFPFPLLKSDCHVRKVALAFWRHMVKTTSSLSCLHCRRSHLNHHSPYWATRWRKRVYVIRCQYSLHL